MKIKFVSAAAAVALGFAAQTAYAEDAPAPEITITGSAALASQYRFRGVSQSDNKPVVQAALTITDKSGFYISTWGSSASGGDSAVQLGGTEIDVFGGYSKTINGFTLDGGLYGYLYPGSTSVNFTPLGHKVSLSYFEIYGDVSKSYGPITAKVGVNWAPKQAVFNDTNTTSKYSMYEYAELSLAVPATALTLHSHLGHTGGGFNAGNGYGIAGKEYIDYTVGAGYKYKALVLDLSVVGTNLGHRAESIAGFYHVGKPVPVLSLTANF